MEDVITFVGFMWHNMQHGIEDWGGGGVISFASIN